MKSLQSRDDIVLRAWDESLRIFLQLDCLATEVFSEERYPGGIEVARCDVRPGQHDFPVTRDAAASRRKLEDANAARYREQVGRARYLLRQPSANAEVSARGIASAERRIAQDLLEDCVAWMHRWRHAEFGRDCSASPR
jgi:hypothetical protein